MFKKPLSNLKTSAPLRSSDRRKLKQRVITSYGISTEEGDSLVPDGILSVKFITRSEEPGVAYIDPEADPLWFTIGKGSEDLIPTIYTLWKKQDLLPFLSTPSAVTPILIGGADLMIPGVIHCPAELREQQLVVVRQYERRDNQPELSPPVAIGRMALPGDQLHSSTTEKGKAVHVLHTWKDYLWDMGSKKDIPESTAVIAASAPVIDDEDGSETEEANANADDATPPPPSPPPEPLDIAPCVTYNPEEVTELLNKALLQAIFTSLKSLPASSFPIPATLLYTNYILPSRPAFPTLVLPPSADIPASASNEFPRVGTEITIKSSNHKSLSTFLKAAEKISLLTLKPPQKQQPDILVMSVNATHLAVASHTPFVTVKDLELKAAQKAAKEERERESEARKEIEIKELWKPHQASVDLFEALGASKSDMFTVTEIRALLNSYITAHNLVNLRDQAYINLDDLLYSCISVQGKAAGKGKAAEPDAAPTRFLKRDELTKNIIGKMQSWHQIRADGHDPVTKKGTLAPVQVVTKIRQGRKASTLISGFEPFLVVDAEEMAEDLRKVCAGATSVSQVHGKPGGAKLEVLVQGKQARAVLEYLVGKGVPKKWIEAADLSGKK
ncbi:hypothetical protein HYPSUDRAFT_55031 [Hypholoma sublateritium FD-334 SS-4]|uniref:SUI1 domain-containing protein n=1 Tax=Hypholoma sublateritium (strain FD-334 SS-4) TaxID=945553 RepID=A0A0D2MET5_HYPSF|nr:hypothetical protein HYPSUDRAFT_55031 [Hypholoma sublateritium FD-334 SS-4]